MDAAADHGAGCSVGLGADGGVAPRGNPVVGGREIAVGGNAQVRSEFVRHTGPDPALERNVAAAVNEIESGLEEIATGHAGLERAMSLDTLRGSKMRSALTVLGVVIGITSIVGMTSLIRGFDQSLRDSISQLGPNTLMVQKWGALSFASGKSFLEVARRPNLTMDDARAIERECPSVALVDVWLGAMRARGVQFMNVEVYAPSDFAGDLMGDLNSRRGRIGGMDSRGTSTVIRAKVPMSEMLTYEQHLTSATGGRGSYHMEFSHYEEVPSHLHGKIISAAKAERGHEAVEEA